MKKERKGTEGRKDDEARRQMKEGSTKKNRKRNETEVKKNRSAGLFIFQRDSNLRTLFTRTHTTHLRPRGAVRSHHADSV